MWSTQTYARKMQEATGNGAGDTGGSTGQSAAPQGAFAGLMAKLGLGSTTPPQPAQQQTQQTQQQAPAPAAPTAPSPSEFFSKLFTPQEPAAGAQDTNKAPTNPWEVSSESLTNTFGNLDVSHFVKP